MKSKILEDKRIKKERLIDAAYSLFSHNDLKNVSIQDIVTKAGVAKGTFYLYFKDKYMLRDHLIGREVSELFKNAEAALKENDIRNFEDSVIFIINHVLMSLENNPVVLTFIKNNLSVGVFHEQLHNALDNEESFNLTEAFLNLVSKYHYQYKDPTIILYLIIEMVGSCCYTSITQNQPLPIRELKPFLFDSIRAILHQGAPND
ncbi:TetR/AcrR family transcriptional regulator [uncultured Dubosiella sp.]|uniref:TetR/AcrR family transcriptional regulator n=1 Tax=uncultured Dubosiella sp. TaxID=1937011 RepID=UPI0025B56CFE|nr:TetR/AcrR family transcriptional regulator [uncultured Dubosiella sp.]